jgi:hypothetical protein
MGFQALFRTRAEHLPYEILCTFRYPRPRFRFKIKVSLQDNIKYALLCPWVKT